jgi:hypothetical protein
MKPLNLKSLLPHLAAVGIFVVVALLFCKQALEGKDLQQSDIKWSGAFMDKQYVQWYARLSNRHQ